MTVCCPEPHRSTYCCNTCRLVCVTSSTPCLVRVVSEEDLQTPVIILQVNTPKSEGGYTIKHTGLHTQNRADRQRLRVEIVLLHVWISETATSHYCFWHHAGQLILCSVFYCKKMTSKLNVLPALKILLFVDHYSINALKSKQRHTISLR